MNQKVIDLFLEKFNMLDRRFDRMDERFNNVETRLERLESKLDENIHATEVNSYKIDQLMQNALTKDELKDFAKENNLKFNFA